MRCMDTKAPVENDGEWTGFERVFEDDFGPVLGEVPSFRVQRKVTVTETGRAIP